MKLSDIFKFKLFEGSDKANLKIVNENFEIAEKELAATNKEITDKVTEINNKITELNGLLGGKLNVSKIANNLVTTEEGYALDARMGKVLADEINKVDCKAIRTDLGSISFSKYGTYLYCGHMTTGDRSNLEPIVLLITYNNTNILGYTSIIENSRYSISINGNVLTINSDYPYVLASLTYMG